MGTYVTSGHKWLKRKENCKLSSLKVAAVAYERWSFTRDSNYKALTEKILVFRKLWSLKRVVARGSSTVAGLFRLEKNMNPFLLNSFCLGE